MSGTNRALNRVLLGLIGFLLLTAGLLTGAAGMYPAVAAEWTATGTALRDNLTAALAGAPLPGGSASWWTIAVLAAALTAMILLGAWIASQGGGRINRAGRRKDPAGTGTTTVETSLVEAAVRDAVHRDGRIVTASVTTWNVKRSDGLKIVFQARKGVSPKDLADAGEELITGLDRVLGDQGPVLIRVTTGLKSRLTGTDRVR